MDTVLEPHPSDHFRSWSIDVLYMTLYGSEATPINTFHFFLPKESVEKFLNLVLSCLCMTEISNIPETFDEPGMMAT